MQSGVALIIKPPEITQFSINETRNHIIYHKNFIQIIFFATLIKNATYIQILKKNQLFYCLQNRNCKMIIDNGTVGSLPDPPGKISTLTCETKLVTSKTHPLKSVGTNLKYIYLK